jgi:hypothetical protein
MAERRGGRPRNAAITGDELRARIDGLGLNYTEAATRLGLTVGGLQKQMRSTTGVSRQTELLLGFIEIIHNAAEAKLDRKTRRRRA